MLWNDCLHPSLYNGNLKDELQLCQLEFSFFFDFFLVLPPILFTNIQIRLLPHVFYYEV